MALDRVSLLQLQDNLECFTCMRGKCVFGGLCWKNSEMIYRKIAALTQMEIHSVKQTQQSNGKAVLGKVLWV